MSQEMKIEPGKKYRTPWEPSGIVEVIRVEPGQHFGEDTAFIRHVDDHPYGYKAGGFGRYLCRELRPLEESP